jgi:hypothetical protein
VREDGEWLAELATLHFELRVERNNPLVHLRERLLALAASVRAEFYEMREPDAAMQKIDPADAGNLESWLVPRDPIEFVLPAASETITRIRAMLPTNADAIQCRLPAANEVALAFHGMQFACWTKQGVFFGPGNSTELLTTSNERALERPLQQLDLHRSPLATDTDHALYRGAPERWLEAMVQKIPQDSTRYSIHAIFIRSFPRSQPVIEVCSICSASCARAAWS